LSEIEEKMPQDDTADSEQAKDSSSIENSPDELNDEMAETVREKDQFKRLAQRAQADLVNYRRRIESEQESSRHRNLQRIVLKFADVIDQLDVALGSDLMNDADPNWLEGITAIHKNFVNAVSSEGFERFDCVGEEFDPRKHEALLSSPTADHAPDTVVTELRPGYMYNGEVVRPAQVQIAVVLPDED
jgi:molecular chaperone GrpE